MQILAHTCSSTLFTTCRPNRARLPAGRHGASGATRLSVRATASREDAAANALGGNPLFTPQFMEVLQGSLARQGPDALTAGSGPLEPRTSATEEVLTTALQQSKQTLAIMMQWRDQIDRQIAVQQKQVDRMEFALNKARNDAAYMRTMKELLHGDL